jgi:lipoyl-dependent peroxiredoxin
MEALYVATATSHGGRSGRAETPGGELDLAIAVPKELGGDGEGTNSSSPRATPAASSTR